MGQKEGSHVDATKEGPGSRRSGDGAVTLPTRYWAKVMATPGCAFGSGLSAGGYRRCDAGGDRIVSAHKALWEDVPGPLPAGVILLHACDETSCVRLSCLSPGDQLADQAQMARRGRTANQWARGCGDGRGPGGRARAGQVEPGGVTLHNDSTAGVGDRWSPGTDRRISYNGGRAFITNGAVSTVTARGG